MNHARRAGFTMVEMVAVVLILSLLIAASSTAISGARKSALRSHARETARQLAAAWTQYGIDQGRFPDKFEKGTVFPANPENIGKFLNTQYLSNGDPVPEKENIIYFEASEAEVKRTGSSLKTATYSGTGIIDRWKNVLYFAIDGDLDGQIDSPLPDEGNINASAIAFSTCGEKDLDDCISNSKNASYRAKVPKSW